MPKQKSMKTTPMARAFFRHYEHKHQLMKQFLAAPTAPSEQANSFSTEFTEEFA